MSHTARIIAQIDAFHLAPQDIVLRRAALSVCATMSDAGNTAEQIRIVLEALGLVRVAGSG